MLGTPRLVFGGIGPYAVLANMTAQALAGKNLNSQSTLAAAMQALQSELNPDTPLDNPNVAYRKSLACALLYKYYLALLPTVNPRVQSGMSSS